jgi:hypothetical protein
LKNVNIHEYASAEQQKFGVSVFLILQLHAAAAESMKKQKTQLRKRIS